MADDYTPTTDEVRAYVEGGGDIGGWGSLTTGQELARVQAFDRWLAAHDAEVRAGRVTVAPDLATLTAWFHSSNEFNYDDCQHGTYAGGPSHGEPYAMCERFARQLLESGVLGAPADQPCDCGCASCPPHAKANCTHTTPENPIDTEPTDQPETPRQMMDRMTAEVRAANPEPDHHEPFTMPSTRIGSASADQRTADLETIEDESSRHRPVLSMKDGHIAGCVCLDRVFVNGVEDWDSHLADAVLAVLVPANQIRAEAVAEYRRANPGVPIDKHDNQVRAETLEAAADALAEHRTAPGGIIGLVQTVYDMGPKVPDAHGAIPWLRARAAEYRTKAAGA